MASPAIYYADNYADPYADIANALALLVRPIKFTLATALAQNDLIYLAPLPGSEGIYLIAWDLEIANMGGNKFEAGDSTAPARFAASDTILDNARSTSLDTIGVVGALPCRYVPDGTAPKLGNDDFILTCTTAVERQTTATTIIGWLLYCQYGTGPLAFGNEP